MLPKRERDISLWTCGPCTFSVCWLTLVLGDGTPTEVWGFFLEYSQVVLQLNPALGALAEPLRHWWGSPGARPRRCRQDRGLQS